jgi:hypothetical protein
MEVPMPFVGSIERGDVMTDVVPYDHSVFQVVQEPFESFLFLYSLSTFVSSHPMDGYGGRIAWNLQQSLKRVFEQDLAGLNSDSANRDDAIRTRVETCGF